MGAEGLISRLSGLFSSGGGAAAGGGLMDLLGKGGMGGANSAMSGPVPGAVLPQSQLNQALTGSPTSTNPMMSSTIGVAASPPSMGSGGTKKSDEWEKWATPQDTSAGLVAGKPNDPMYGQMMQQVMQQPQQQQQQQQPQRQPMSAAGVFQMPQMPGAVHPNATWDTLLKMLSGGG
jgi:hypothetical protein